MPILFFIPLVFKLHDPLESIRIFAQNFSTNCPKAVQNSVEKFKSLPRMQQRYRQTTDWRLIT